MSGRREKEREGGPDPEDPSWSLRNLPPDEVGCKNCAARGAALLNPCTGVVDGGVHETVIVPGAGGAMIPFLQAMEELGEERSRPGGKRAARRAA